MQLIGGSNPRAARRCARPWTLCQRAKGQEEIEHKQHYGSRRLVGVNTYRANEHAGDIVTAIKLILSTRKEKAQQIACVEAFRGRGSKGPLENPTLKGGRKPRLPSKEAAAGGP